MPLAFKHGDVLFGYKEAVSTVAHALKKSKIYGTINKLRIFCEYMNGTIRRFDFDSLCVDDNMFHRNKL